MRIFHISDTHGQHGLLTSFPDADVLVHSGDVTRTGTAAEVAGFIDWLHSLPYRHKIFVAGNNDRSLHRTTPLQLPPDCHCLRYSGVTVDGIKFWGLPLITADVMHCLYDIRIQEIPSDTDVLISHEPPYSILDYANGCHIGNPQLLRKVDAIRPRAHLFGHAHGQNGMETIGDIVLSNAVVTAACNCRQCNPNDAAHLIEL